MLQENSKENRDRNFQTQEAQHKSN